MPSIYIHIPFCDGKCPYCDFYSLRGDEALMDRYTAALRRSLGLWKGRGLPAETVYLGGGTPTVLGARRLSEILEAAADCFAIAPGAEITVEANPTHVDRALFAALRQAGANRLSLGLQSAHREELRLLGRRHTERDAAQAVEDAMAAGFRRLSLDLMLALPGGSEETVGGSIQFAAGLGVEHLSAYLLKVEAGTPFAAQGIKPLDEDAAARQYLFAVEELARLGYAQYEISNFARPGGESRHNLVYWRDEEYLGFGPGAHSFFEGRRFFYPRDLDAFLAGAPPQDDGPGGDLEEMALLALRLTEGLTRRRCGERFGPQGEAWFDRLARRAAACPPRLIRLSPGRVALTPEGFLVFNTLLGRLLA